MNRNVPTEKQIEAAYEAGAHWAASIDYHGNQCRTLVPWGFCLNGISGCEPELPIHQTCALRAADRSIIYEPPQA